MTDKATLAPSNAEIAFVWFQRAIAVYCLLFGVLYWIRLVGFYPGRLWRFDLMPVLLAGRWRLPGRVFSLRGNRPVDDGLLGAVVWLICAVAETLMYVGYPELFGQRLPIVGSHAVALALYAALWFWLAQAEAPSGA